MGVLQNMGVYKRGEAKSPKSTKNILIGKKKTQKKPRKKPRKVINAGGGVTAPIATPWGHPC